MVVTDFPFENRHPVVEQLRTLLRACSQTSGQHVAEIVQALEFAAPHRHDARWWRLEQDHPLWSLLGEPRGNLGEIKDAAARALLTELQRRGRLQEVLQPQLRLADQPEALCDRPPLPHLFAIKGYIGSILYLVEQGADFSCKDSLGRDTMARLGEWDEHNVQEPLRAALARRAASRALEDLRTPGPVRLSR